MVTINAITLKGTFPISIKDDDTVFSIKRRVGLAAGYAADDIRLYNKSRGVFIDNDDLSFRDIAQEMNMQDGTPIHVILKLRASGAKKRRSDHEEPASKSRRLHFKSRSKKSGKNKKSRKVKKSVTKKSRKTKKSGKVKKSKKTKKSATKKSVRK
jgi:hypothetical protein